MLRLLLPRGRAWAQAIRRPLVDFIEGLSAALNLFRGYIDDIYDDIFPATTRQLDEWEDAFALPKTLTDDAERRARLDAAWKAVGGQSPRYIQDTLQAAGFPVYVHEWWAPASRPAVGQVAGYDGYIMGSYSAGILGAYPTFSAIPRNAFDYIAQPGNYSPAHRMGDGVTTLGGAATVGALTGPQGYLLVNKILVTRLLGVVTMGRGDTLGGVATLGKRDGVVETPKEYFLSGDALEWRHMMYVGGATFPDVVTLPSNRRAEFETLLLKIRPLNLWIGALVNYS